MLLNCGAGEDSWGGPFDSKKIKPVEFLLPTDAKDIKSNPELMKMLGMGGGDDDDDE